MTLARHGTLPKMVAPSAGVVVDTSAAVSGAGEGTAFETFTVTEVVAERLAVPNAVTVSVCVPFVNALVSRSPVAPNV